MVFVGFTIVHVVLVFAVDPHLQAMITDGTWEVPQS